MGNFSKSRQKSATTALICSLLAITLGACETGWRLSLTLNIPPALDRTRQLKVLLFEARTIQGGQTAPLYPLKTWLEADSIKGDTIELQMFDPGCVHKAAMALAWAPALRVAAGSEGWRKPASGDYFASTGWVAKQPCGGDGVQKMVLNLQPVSSSE